MTKYLYWGAPAALLGAIGAFALDKDDPSAFGLVRLEPLGLILMIAGVLVLLWGAVDSYRRSTRGRGRGAKQAGDQPLVATVGGLIAVAVGVGAVAALSIIALTVSTGLGDTSTVSIATAAFGVISAIVGAYLGIKISSEQAGEAKKSAEAEGITLGAATAVVGEEGKAELEKRVADAKGIGEKARSGS